MHRDTTIMFESVCQEMTFYGTPLRSDNSEEYSSQSSHGDTSWKKFMNTVLRCKNETEIKAVTDERIQMIKLRALREHHKGLRRQSISMINILQCSVDTSRPLNANSKDYRSSSTRRCSESALDDLELPSVNVATNKTVSSLNHSTVLSNHSFISEETIEKFRRFRASLGSLASSSDSSGSPEKCLNLTTELSCLENLAVDELTENLSLIEPQWDSPISSETSDECVLPSVSRRSALNNRSFVIPEDTLSRYQGLKASISYDEPSLEDEPTLQRSLSTPNVSILPVQPPPAIPTELKIKTVADSPKKKGPLKAVLPVQKMTKMAPRLEIDSYCVPQMLVKGPVATSTPDNKKQIDSTRSSRQDRSFRSHRRSSSHGSQPPAQVKQRVQISVNGLRSRTKSQCKITTSVNTKMLVTNSARHAS